MYLLLNAIGSCKGLGLYAFLPIGFFYNLFECQFDLNRDSFCDYQLCLNTRPCEKVDDDHILCLFYLSIYL